MAARMPRVVREHEILRVAASIGGKNPSSSADVARREILKWAEKRSGGRLPKEAWALQDFEYLSGGRDSVGVRIQNEVSDIWAIRADDPDKNIPGRSWTTEVIVGLMRDKAPQFSARLLASTPEDELDIAPHTPGFVQQVSENCILLRGTYQITAEPWTVESDDEADRLAEFLVDQNRALPLFVLSVSDSSEAATSPLLDATALARATLGTGCVVILPSAFTWALTERFGKLCSVFGGAVRAYLPGLRKMQIHTRIRHPRRSTFNSGRRSTMFPLDEITCCNGEHSPDRVRADVLYVCRYRNAKLEIMQRRLREEGASDAEQLAAANARIEALEREFDAQKASLDYFDIEHKVAEERAETAEEQARASAFRIQQLIEQIKTSGGIPDDKIELPVSWVEFPNWCDVNLAGRVVLGPAARRGARSPQFEDYKLAARCLYGSQMTVVSDELTVAQEALERKLSKKAFATHIAAKTNLIWIGRANDTQLIGT